MGWALSSLPEFKLVSLFSWFLVIWEKVGSRLCCLHPILTYHWAALIICKSRSHWCICGMLAVGCSGSEGSVFQLEIGFGEARVSSRGRELVAGE